MPDATDFEWLVTHAEEHETQYDYFATLDGAIEHLRQLVGQGTMASLYQRVPCIGVTVKAPRKRRKTPSPADKPESDAPTGPGNGEAGEPQVGAASPQAAELPETSRTTSERAMSSVASTASDLASPVFDCEARFDGDPPCALSVTLDPVTKGHFCLLHMVQMTESARREMHRRHGSRNHPVRVAHAG